MDHRHPDRWPDAIRAGDPRALDALSRLLRFMASDHSPRLDLTEREVDVLQALADTGTTRGVARELGITVDTVKHHTKSIRLKLGARNSPHMVALGLRRRLIS